MGSGASVAGNAIRRVRPGLGATAPAQIGLSATFFLISSVFGLVGTILDCRRAEGASI